MNKYTQITLEDVTNPLQEKITVDNSDGMINSTISGYFIVGGEKVEMAFDKEQAKAYAEALLEMVEHTEDSL